MWSEELTRDPEGLRSLNGASHGAPARPPRSPWFGARVRPDQVMDAAFRGDPCEVLDADGRVSLLPTTGWAAPADHSDVQLFIRGCGGPTLDVGCGPGRLAGALARAGHTTLGVDVSAEAVRQTRAQGSPATRADIMSGSCALGGRTWAHMMLADGNIGIGGRPAHLLGRLATQLRPRGTILVEIDPTEAGLTSSRIQIRTSHLLSEPFDWARVGADAIEQVAGEAGLRLRAIGHSRGRTVATLVHRG